MEVEWELTGLDKRVFLLTRDLVDLFYMDKYGCKRVVTDGHPSAYTGTWEDSIFFRRKIIYVGNENGTIQRIERNNVKFISQEERAPVTSILYDDGFLLTGHEDGSFFVWNNRGRIVFQDKKDNSPVTAIAKSGRDVAYASGGNVYFPTTNNEEPIGGEAKKLKFLQRRNGKSLLALVKEGSYKYLYEITGKEYPIVLPFVNAQSFTVWRSNVFVLEGCPPSIEMCEIDEGKVYIKSRFHKRGSSTDEFLNLEILIYDEIPSFLTHRKEGGLINIYSIEQNPQMLQAQRLAPLGNYWYFPVEVIGAHPS